MDRIAEHKFDEIKFTGAERQILELMKEGKNFQEIATVLGKEASTLFKQMNAIYNKTKNIVVYQSRVRRFLTLQYFLTDPDISINSTKLDKTKSKIKPRFTFDDDEIQFPDKNNELDEVRKQLQAKEKENDELRSQIKKLENTPPRMDFEGIKNKIKSEIEKLSQKLCVIEELEEMMKG